MPHPTTKIHVNRFSSVFSIPADRQTQRQWKHNLLGSDNYDKTFTQMSNRINDEVMTVSKGQLHFDI